MLLMKSSLDTSRISVLDLSIIGVLLPRDRKIVPIYISNVNQKNNGSFGGQ